jgi:hypothetical protein
MAILTSVQRYAFFCDESGITQDRFTLVGGLIIPVDEVKNIQIVLKNFREQQGMKKELKWTKITNQKLNEYQSLVGTFFQFNMEDKCHFQCICIDSHKLNHQRFNSGDRDVGLSKIYFQLLYHKFVKTHGRNNLLYVHLRYSPDSDRI